MSEKLKNAIFKLPSYGISGKDYRSSQNTMCGPVQFVLVSMCF